MKRRSGATKAVWPIFALSSCGPASIPAAPQISALMKYRGLDVEEAARTAIQGRLAAMGGDGGVIVVDREGNIAMEFNTEGMFRGARSSEGKRKIEIY